MDELQARSLIETAIAPHIVRTSANISEDERREAIDDSTRELVSFWEHSSESAPTPIKISALLPLRYVIPDQDLKLVETVFSVLTATAGVGYFLPAGGFEPSNVKALTVAVTAVTLAMLRIMRNLKLAARLEQGDYAIVAVLARAKPIGLSSEGIVEILQASDSMVTDEAVQMRLASLSAYPTVGGTKSALVWKGGDGLWYANGI